MSYRAWQAATLKVYDRDATTLRDTVKVATGASWTDELKSEGAASYTVPWVQAALATDPDLLRDGIVKAFVPLTDGGTPTAVMAWLSQPGQGTLVSERDKADKQETPACRGIRALLDDWVVLHDGGFSTFAGDTRSFGWMSIDYDDSGWSTPMQQAWFGDPSARAGFPEIMATLYPGAHWIALLDPSTGVLPDGAVNYFRAVYTNPTERRLRFYVVADNYVDFYINGEPIYLADESQDAYGWRDVQDPPYQRIFAAGPITMAAKVTNAALTTGDNPIALLVVVVTLDANGNPDQIVAKSNPTTWVVTDDVTGLTAAQILLRLNDEADDRGITSAGQLTPSFTATTPTGGGSWPDLQERAWEIGTKGSQVVSDLESVAFDLDVRPDLAVNAYISQGSDLSATVAITEGVTLLSYTYQGQALVCTRLLVRTNDRWLYLTDAGAEATYQPREHFLESGLSLSSAQGTAVGEANLDDLARETFAYTAVIVCTTHPDSVTPYSSFNKGDIISAYNYRMERADLQVTSISGEVGDEGIVRWTIELREP